MKKSIIALGIVMISIASCAKKADYTCNCTTTTEDDQNPFFNSVTVATFTERDVEEQEAILNCADRSSIDTFGSTTTTIDCFLLEN